MVGLNEKLKLAPERRKGKEERDKIRRYNMTYQVLSCKRSRKKPCTLPESLHGYHMLILTPPLALCANSLENQQHAGTRQPYICAPLSKKEIRHTTCNSKPPKIYQKAAPRHQQQIAGLLSSVFAPHQPVRKSFQLLISSSPPHQPLKPSHLPLKIQFH